MLLTFLRPFFPLTLCLLATACGLSPESRLLNAIPRDSNTSLAWFNPGTGKQLLLVTGGKAYPLDTKSPDCRVLTGFGFRQPNLDSLPVLSESDPLVQNSGKQPTLLCLPNDAEQAAQIRGLRVLRELGKAPRYFYLFQGSAQKFKYYELGCQQLVGAFAQNLSGTIPVISKATLTDVSELNCLAGEAFPGNGRTLAEWCARPNPSPDDKHTLDILLAEAGTQDCAAAEASLRAKHSDNALNLSNKNLTSIGPLETLQWLRDLDLSGNAIQDVTGLGRLNKLVSLKLKGNRVEDIQALSALTGLQTLDLESNRIKSLAPLRGLSLLTSVQTRFNADLKPYDPALSFFETCLLKTSMLPAGEHTVDAVLELVHRQTCGQAADALENTVETLDFSDLAQPVEDVRPLASLARTRVTTLDLRGQNLSDAEPLRFLDRLESLDLSNTAIDPEKCPYESGPEVLRTFCHSRSQTFVYWCRHPGLSPSATLTVELLRKFYRKNAPQPPVLMDCGGLYESLMAGLNLGNGYKNTLDLQTGSESLTDLRPLRGLSGVKRLWIGGSPSDITTLRYFPQLEQLNISGGLIASLEPLRNATRLQSLRLVGTTISDLTPLSRMSELRELAIDSNQISDLSPLATLTNMEILDFGSGRFRSLLPLRPLTHLRELRIMYSPLESLNGLETLTNMQQLTIGNARVSDLSPLQTMVGMKHLNLLNIDATSLTALANMKALENLGIYHVPISDLSGLQNKPNMQNIFLLDTRVRDLNPLAGLVSLQQLQVTKSTIVSMEPLKDLVGLRSLWLVPEDSLNTSPATLDTTALSRLTNLEELTLQAYTLPHIAGLANMGSLISLNLSLTTTSDLSPLRGLTKLTRLNVSSNHIRDFSVLAYNQNLESLEVADNWFHHYNHYTDPGFCPLDSINVTLRTYCQSFL